MAGMSALPVEYVDDFDGFAVGSAVVGGVDDARVVALLGEVEPGVLAMTLLRGLELERLDELQRIEVAAAWERQQAWVAAQAQLALAAVTADLPGMAVAEQVKAREFRTDLIAACLRWSPVAAGNKLAVAERLAGDLPLTMASLEAGSISFRHAFVLADAVLGLQPDEVAFVEARVIEKAAQQTVAQFTPGGAPGGAGGGTAAGRGPPRPGGRRPAGAAAARGGWDGRSDRAPAGGGCRNGVPGPGRAGP